MGKEEHAIDGVIDLIAGALGGVATVYSGQPLDTIKVKLQTFPHLYRNAAHCFVQTFRDGGVRSLYAGTVPSLAANIAENAVLFSAYGAMQKTVATCFRVKDTRDMTTLQNAISGSGASIFSAMALCPTELIKCKMQAMKEVMASGEHIMVSNRTQRPRQNKITPWSVTKQVVANHGILGLWRGQVSTWVREIPGYFFFFGGYELSRTFFAAPSQNKDEIGTVRTAVSGAIGGVCLWVVVFPADVVKSRMQVFTSQHQLPIKTPQFLPTLLTIINKEGFFTLYKGLGPTVLRTCPATAALFVTYEYSKWAMNNCLQR